VLHLQFLDNECYIYLVFEGEKKEITTKILGDDRTFCEKTAEKVPEKKNEPIVYRQKRKDA
jgi:hypothetical protein